MKNNNRRIFVVFHCDAWVSTESMRVAFCTTSVRKLKSFIVSKIKDETFSYGVAETPSKKIKEFSDDWKNLNRDDINNKLEYGFYDWSYDGEECIETSTVSISGQNIVELVRDYERDCHIDDIMSKIDEHADDGEYSESTRNQLLKKIDSIVDYFEDNLSKNDSYYESYWASVDESLRVAIEE